MCPFVEKKEKSVVFNLTYTYQETAYTIFQLRPSPPYYSNPHPPLLLINIAMSNLHYYLGLESSFTGVKCSPQKGESNL